MLRADLKLHLEHKTEAEHDYLQAIKNFSKYIKTYNALPKAISIESIQKLGQAYMLRARAYDSLGKKNMAAQDRQNANNQGVFVDIDCEIDSDSNHPSRELGKWNISNQ